MITDFRIRFVNGVAGTYLETDIYIDGGLDPEISIYPLSTQTQVEGVKHFQRQVVDVTPNSPFPGYNSGGVTYTAMYEVWVRTSGQPALRIDMGTVSNQGTWVNTLTGMNTCVSDILAALP